MTMANLTTKLVGLCSLLVVCFVAFSAEVPRANASAAIAIDLGSLYYKVGMIQRQSFDVVLNKESKRRVLTTVGFSHLQEERVYNSAAEHLMRRKPLRVFPYVNELLGRSFDHPIVQHLRENHIFYDIVEQSDGRMLIVKDEETSYSPEELVAMILKQAADMATEAAGFPVKDVVIVIPPFVTQGERLALNNAAKLAGLSINAFIHPGTAVGIKFALSRANEITEEPTNLVFFDMGHASTVATLVQFQQVKDLKKNATVPNLTVKAVAWDETLGGREFDLALRRDLTREAQEKLGDEHDIASDIRMQSALSLQVRKLKETLSLNASPKLSMESFHGDFDFKTSVTREHFDELTTTLCERTKAVLARLMAESNLTLADIDSVELLGGASRIPSVQTALKEFFEIDALGRHIDADEAAVLGGTFFAATKSKRFSIRTDLKVKDMISFPIVVNVSSSDIDVKTTRLFKRGNRPGAKKNLSFKTMEDFTTVLSYAEPAEGDVDTLPPGTPRQLIETVISGVPNYDTHPNMTVKPKVNLQYHLDDFDNVAIRKAEAEIVVIEMQKKLIVKVKDAAETNNNGRDDGDSTTDDVKETDEKAEEDEADIAKETDAETAPETTDDADVDADAGAADASAEGDANAEGAADAEPKPDSDAETEAEEVEEEKEDEAEYEYKEVKRTKTISLDYNVTHLGFPQLTSDEKKASWERLSALDKIDAERLAIEEAMNSLESLIYNTREKLTDNEEVISASTEQERDDILEELSTSRDWLEDEGQDVKESKEFKSRSKTIENAFGKITKRISEQVERPKAAAAMRLAFDEVFEAMTTITVERNVTEEEVESLTTWMNEQLDWLSEKEAEQESKEVYEDGAFSSYEPATKVTLMGYRWKTLKYKPKRPKTTPKPEGTDETDVDIEKDSDDTADADADADADTQEAPVEQEVTEEEGETEEENERSGENSGVEADEL
eukprot:TRINITY_DN1482_c4_g1_i1.p1 TRINITY_DN1482_c4_g1~~TRINITY_DN1482_c4_g1_i1.p1  ORF type:complete len:959 (+),score=360.00 TRINITY_DN1482_c4_g1_i1:101-2977(+)